MSNPLMIFDEPDLEFRFGQKLKDPHDGLGLFGPYDADQTSHPTSLNYIAIGTPDGLKSLESWMTAMNRPVTAVPKDNYRLWPPFPGFEAVFNCQLYSKPVQSFGIDKEHL